MWPMSYPPSFGPPSTFFLARDLTPQKSVANRAPYSSVSSSVLIVRGSTRPIGSHVATEVSMPELRPSQLQG